MYDRIGREMDNAIAKHGPVTAPNHHIEDFYDDIEAKKADIVRTANA